jgi:hypothetical protein
LALAITLIESAKAESLTVVFFLSRSPSLPGPEKEESTNLRRLGRKNCQAHPNRQPQKMLEARMDDHTKAEEFGTERAFSKLDWPTPEMLVSAHRARARVLREMTVALGRKLGTLIKNRLFKSGLSHGGSDSAQENAHMTIASVAMFRNQMRRDIRTMQAGHDPAGLCRDASVIPTYCSDTVVRLSLETNWATDRKLMSKTGRQLADGPAHVERAARCQRPSSTAARSNASANGRLPQPKPSCSHPGTKGLRYGRPDNGRFERR